MSEEEITLSFLKYNVSTYIKTLALKQHQWWSIMIEDSPSDKEFQRRCNIVEFHLW